MVRLNGVVIEVMALLMAKVVPVERENELVSVLRKRPGDVCSDVRNVVLGFLSLVKVEIVELIGPENTVGVLIGDHMLIDADVACVAVAIAEDEEFIAEYINGVLLLLLISAKVIVAVTVFVLLEADTLEFEVDALVFVTEKDDVRKLAFIAFVFAIGTDDVLVTVVPVTLVVVVLVTEVSSAIVVGKLVPEDNIGKALVLVVVADVVTLDVLDVVFKVEVEALMLTGAIEEVFVISEEENVEILPTVLLMALTVPLEGKKFVIVFMPWLLVAVEDVSILLTTLLATIREVVFIRLVIELVILFLS